MNSIKADRVDYKSSVFNGGRCCGAAPAVVLLGGKYYEGQSL